MCFAAETEEMHLENDGAASGSIFAWDYVLWEVRLKLVAAGFFIYLGVFLLSHYLSSWMSISYCLLPAKDKFFLRRAAMRGAFGIQGCVGGLWALLLDPVFQADKVYSQQDWSWFHCLTASGYFLVENATLIVYFLVFRTFDPFIFIHHILAFGGYFGLVANIKSGHYIPLMGMMLDMCTPFTCISWMLMKVGRANTFFWKANQWVVIHIFHCRMIIVYHMWWVIISNWNAVLENLGLLHFAVVFTGLSVLTVILNPYWIYIVTQRLFCPDEWNLTNTKLKDESSKTLNEETFEKKGL